jgi:hypothetical protein
MNTGLLLAGIIIIIILLIKYNKNNEYYVEKVPKYLYLKNYEGYQYQNKKAGCQPYGDRTSDVFSSFFTS